MKMKMNRKNKNKNKIKNKKSNSLTSKKSKHKKQMIIQFLSKSNLKNYLKEALLILQEVPVPQIYEEGLDLKLDHHLIKNYLKMLL
jgi:hypothetical protein